MITEESRFNDDSIAKDKPTEKLLNSLMGLISPFIFNKHTMHSSDKSKIFLHTHMSKYILRVCMKHKVYIHGKHIDSELLTI